MSPIQFIRTLRTATSERFLLTLNGKHESASLDLHYLHDSGVAGTLCILDSSVDDDQIAAVIEQIDEVLLPEANRNAGNLHFTVVRGTAIGDFVPHARTDSATHR